MKTPPVSIFFFALASLLGAVGQILYKEGASLADGTLKGYLLNARLLGGVACYISVMVLFVAAFKKGGALTVLYPVYATTFIWAAIFSVWLYQTQIKPINTLGMALLLLGMYLMGR